MWFDVDLEDGSLASLSGSGSEDCRSGARGVRLPLVRLQTKKGRPVSGTPLELQIAFQRFAVLVEIPIRLSLCQASS